MNRRTIVGAGMALIAAAAIPLGLPHSASASGYTSLVFSPLPIAQPGTLAASTTVDLCVQPETAPKQHVPGTVYLSILSGLFTSPSHAGGTAMVGTTALTSTPAPFLTSPTCTVSAGTFTDGVLVAYTSASSLPLNGRDVISAADVAADAATVGTGGICPPSVPCSTGTYVYSPVTSYTLSPTPIAAIGTLTAGQIVDVTVTALDSTDHPVPGAYLDLSLTSTGTAGGRAEAFNEISIPPAYKQLNNSAQRVGATNLGTVAVVYTAANPLPSSGLDTITAQNHPAETVEQFTTYSYGASSAPPSNPYTPVTPFRVCDTRPAVGGVPVNQCNSGSTGAGSGPIGSGQTRVVTIGGFGTVPATGVTAVVVNVTAVAPTKATFLEVFPDLKSAPGTSSLNPLAGEVVANLVEVGVSAAGKIDVFNDLGTINVVVDIEGYVSSTSIGLYTAAAAPVRICDTRAPGGGIPTTRCNTSGASPIGPGATLTFPVSGAGSPVPGTGVTAVVFNLTGISPSQSTVLTAFTGTPRPTASNLNINPHTAVPNRVIVPVTCSAGSCSVSIWNSVGTINIAVDIDGYFSATGASSFTALPNPVRLCNTQNGNPSVQGCTKGLVAAGSANVRNISVTNVDGIPSSATAIVANVTAVNATTATFVTVYPGPAGATVPGVSDINVTSMFPVPNLVVVGVGSDGSINLFNDVGNINFIVDVVGYYS